MNEKPSVEDILIGPNRPQKKKSKAPIIIVFFYNYYFNCWWSSGLLLLYKLYGRETKVKVF